MKKKLLLPVFCFLLPTSMSLNGCEVVQESKEEQYVENHEIYGSNANYDVLNNGHIAVGMWVTPKDTMRTDEMFKYIAESGINVVNGFAYYENTEEEIKQVLDYCEKYNLKYLLASLEIENDIKKYAKSQDEKHIKHTMELIGKFANHKAFCGTLFIDEPNASILPAIGDFYKEYLKTYPDKLAYVNLFPSYAVAGTGYSQYEDYIDNWFSKTNAKLLSYDHYPLIKYDPTQEGYAYEYKDYYYSLDILRSKTLKQGVPLWTFSATLGYDHQTELSRRIPSREDIRWTVFSNLAFGAKGIQYFCYCTPDQDSYSTAMIDRQGNKTERYDYVKEVNTEFKNYESILLNSDAVGVMMYDYRRNGYELFEAPLKSFGPIKNVEGNRYLIGCFQDKDNGKKSILITPTTPRDDITITLNMYKNIKNVNAYVHGQKTNLEVKDGKLELTINKGDSVLISFE